MKSAPGVNRGAVVRIVSAEAVNGLSQYPRPPELWKCIRIAQKRPKAVVLAPLDRPDGYYTVVARPWCLKRLKKAELRALEQAK